MSATWTAEQHARHERAREAEKAARREALAAGLPREEREARATAAYVAVWNSEA